MQIKKNPKADLTKNSNLYFAIGLAVILFISWRAIEWKTYDKSGYGYEALNIDDDDDEEVPITEQIKTPPPPPPPPPAPEIIEVVEDEEEIEETIIESTETDQEEIVEIVEVEEEFEDVDVPFAVIEDVPIYPGCERVAKSKRRDCFQEQINKHIRKNFRYPEIAQEMGIQGRVYVNFVIDKDGSITSIRMRGPDKNLEKEAQRIISKLPRMTPGKQRGRAVRVPFSIPITFRLQ
ncbi:MAG: energy transducer TonB [Flavobacteriales bacterium]|nr:MAG: energy transducer TonB [Flavobacteriales bacterium TMED96]RZP09884.1 MAG: energy transducer TonB [Flavobacteriales bacterium]|tara:strand:- start:2465 stop:3169 length:705 start_codon:yes stop_codon:yes gene_type:complete